MRIPQTPGRAVPAVRPGWRAAAARRRVAPATAPSAAGQQPRAGSRTAAQRLSQAGRGYGGAFRVVSLIRSKHRAAGVWEHSADGRGRRVRSGEGWLATRVLLYLSCRCRSAVFRPSVNFRASPISCNCANQLRPDSSVVERGPEKAGVGGSIPSLATTS